MGRNRSNPVPDSATGAVCSHCREHRAAQDWYWKPGGKRHGWCKPCVDADGSARHARTYVPKKSRTAPCERCGIEFTTKLDSRRFCSRTCIQLARNEVEKAERAARAPRKCEGCSADISGRRIDVRWCSNTCAGRRPTRRASVRRSRLKTQYGLTGEQFDAMLAKQGGRCAICRSRDPKHTNWSVDHDHVTGQVRSILCGGCNTGIGQLQDDPDIIRAALEYVVRHRQMVLPI